MKNRLFKLVILGLLLIMQVTLLVTKDFDLFPIAIVLVGLFCVSTFKDFYDDYCEKR